MEAMRQAARNWLSGRTLLATEHYSLFLPDGQTRTDTRAVYDARTHAGFGVYSVKSCRSALDLHLEPIATRTIVYDITVFLPERAHSQVMQETLTFTNLLTQDGFVATATYLQPLTPSGAPSTSTVRFTEFVVQSASGAYRGATTVVAEYDNTTTRMGRALYVYSLQGEGM